jgi:ethanolamine ammonia-lyase small subunit
MSNLVRTPGLNLRDYTPARVSLPCAGHSIATSEVLNFQLAHAQARDAVHAALHAASFVQRLRDELPSVAEMPLSILTLRTNAPDRATYLRRPDLGRSLHPDSAIQLQGVACDLALVIADGLSALAVDRNAIPLLRYLLPQLRKDGWTIGPIALVSQGRVAIGDEVGSLLGAQLSLVLIGERPGLSSPTSLGAYITWRPHPERTDADRNCVSNICADGLSPELAASRILRYLRNARAGQLTGITLKDDPPALP